MSAAAPVPAVSFRPFFRAAGRAVSIVPGETGAEDLEVLTALAGPVSAGRFPAAPTLVTTLTVQLGGASAACGSGWRQTRATGTHWNSGVNVELFWPRLDETQRSAMLAFLLDVVKIGSGGGTSLLAVTVDIDGAGLIGSAVDLLIDAPSGPLENLLERIAGTTGLYSLGPLTARELLT